MINFTVYFTLIVLIVYRAFEQYFNSLKRTLYKFDKIIIMAKILNYNFPMYVDAGISFNNILLHIIKSVNLFGSMRHFCFVMILLS